MGIFEHHSGCEGKIKLWSFFTLFGTAPPGYVNNLVGHGVAPSLAQASFPRCSLGALRAWRFRSRAPETSPPLKNRSRTPVTRALAWHNRSRASVNSWVVSIGASIVI